MGGPHRHVLVALACAGAVLGTSFVLSSSASAGGPNRSQADEIAAYWTPERVASAQPRDLVVDQRGLGYMRGRDGSLTPHGHDVAPSLTQVLEASVVSQPTTRAKPVPGGDTTPPTIVSTSPAAGATVGAQSVFSVVVTDQSGVASVSIVIHYPTGRTQSFPAAFGPSGAWETTITGFTNGSWGWHVIAKDTRNNTRTSSTFAFTVDTGGGGGGGGGDGVVTNAEWPTGGVVQQAAGRILFEMPTVNHGRTTWTAYVCSGTLANDGAAGGTSIIITAAHCVYDDVAKQFARNVLFIPNQAGTSGAGTDRDCSNDPLGCWAPSYGVVDVNWTAGTFPDNVKWDYAYYVVGAGSHSGAGTNGALDSVVTPLPIGFNSDLAANPYTHAFGYSYSDDPNFMYCAENLGVKTQNVNWWLANCALTGGSSGGPWIEPLDSTGSGPIISLNSWGYTNQPGMAGPVLGASAQCTFNTAVASTGPSGTTRGLLASC